MCNSSPLKLGSPYLDPKCKTPWLRSLSFFCFVGWLTVALNANVTCNWFIKPCWHIFRGGGHSPTFEGGGGWGVGWGGGWGWGGIYLLFTIWCRIQDIGSRWYFGIWRSSYHLYLKETSNLYSKYKGFRKFVHFMLHALMFREQPRLSYL